MKETTKLEKELDATYQIINETEVFLSECNDSIVFEPKIKKENVGNGLFKEKRLKKELLNCYEVLLERQTALIKEQQKILQQLDGEIDNIVEKREALTVKVERLEVVVNKITIALNSRDELMGE